MGALLSTTKLHTELDNVRVLLLLFSSCFCVYCLFTIAVGKELLRINICLILLVNRAALLWRFGNPGHNTFFKNTLINFFASHKEMQYIKQDFDPLNNALQTVYLIRT